MISDDYSCRQSARDTEYESAYRQWADSMPAHERQRLQANGLDAPAVQRRGTGSPKGDVADSSLMSEGCDPALEPAQDCGEVHQDGDEQVWDTMRRLLGELLCHDNARLTVECLSLVSGLSFTGCSMTEIARRHGVTRAAVSKRCVELTKTLDLQPSRAMRSLTTRKLYRDARINSNRNHEQPSYTSDQ